MSSPILYSPRGELQYLVGDFESYWDSKVSLRHMSIDQYVPLANPIMFTAKWGDGDDTVAYVGMEAMTEFFNSVDWSRTVFIAHNCPFDAAMLHHWFGHIAHRYFCTMMAARPHWVPFSKSMALGKLADWLGLATKKGNFASASARGKHLEDFTPAELHEYIQYGLDDTTICYEFFRRLESRLDDKEKLMIHATVRKSVVQTLVLDRPLIEDALFNERLRKQNLFKQTGLDPEQIMSNAKFAKVLLQLGVSAPKKISPRTGKEAYAFAKTDADFLKLLNHKDERVRTAVECRMHNKSTIEESRLTRFLSITEYKETLPFPLMFYAAHTGRLGGSDKLNMQNLTKGSALREGIMSPEGWSMVVSDLSQIEARMVAWLAKVMRMLEAFSDPSRDVYCEFGTGLGLWGTVTKETTKERFVSKMGVLSLMYGVGVDRFAESINTSPFYDGELSNSDSMRVVKGYRNQYPEIPALWNLLENFVGDMIRGKSQSWGPLRFVGYGECDMYGGAPCILLPEGRVMYYPNLQHGTEGDGMKYIGARGTRYLWGGTILENISQALSQIVIRNAELRMIQKGSYHDVFYAVGQVHDELLYCVPDHHAPKFAEVLQETMTEGDDWNQAGPLPLPLEAETEVARRYSECK